MVDESTEPTKTRRRRKRKVVRHRFATYTVVGKAGRVESMKIHSSLMIDGQRFYLVSIDGIVGVKP